MTKDQILALQDESVFGKNLYKYVEFCSWCRWFPDLFLDLIHPPSGGIHLNSDQRVYLRAVMRFVSLYGVFPRGYSKTYIEVVGLILAAIFFPGIDLAMTAQTKENAAELLRDKYKEIVTHWPMLANEVVHARFSRNDAEILFVNGSKIDNLANAQSSKGQRRKRISIEEANLLNDATFQDALKPIVEVPRYTVGKLGIADPCELNQQINFYTTSGFKGSDEYQRSLKMYDGMVNLTGDMVLGASWFLPCWYGRGSSKSQILKKKADMSPVAFSQNYESKWVGSSDSALVNINRLLDCRSLTAPQLDTKKDEEWYLGVDVARSQKDSNNKTSIVAVRIKRNHNKTRIISYDVANVCNISNTLNFTAQACIVKQYKRRYNAQAVVMDGNGLGAGLIDECLKESYDPITGESLGCFDTINDDNVPESPETAEKVLYNLKAQSVQSKVITNFIGVVESEKLRLLVPKQLQDFTVQEQDDFENRVAPFLETNALFEEVANLRLKTLPSGGVGIEKVVKRLDKDRSSALMYVLWYINEFARDLAAASAYGYQTFIN